VGYAAVVLPKNSVGTRQLKANAVVSSKVKNGGLKAIDFAAGASDRAAGSAWAAWAHSSRSERGWC